MGRRLGSAPTFHGYAAAPNKGLREALSQHGLEIRMVDEYHTSQYTACCLAKSRYSVQRAGAEPQDAGHAGASRAATS